MIEDYSLEGCIVSHARSAEAKEEFTVVYFPHWIEFLVHPNVSFSSKGKLAKNMRVKKSNPQGTGRNCVGGYLQILGEANDLTWSMSKVHWDGECIASWVNHWQIQPLDDPIPGRLKHRIPKLRPRRSNPSKKAPTLETSSNTEDVIPESNTGDVIPIPESNTGNGIPNPESNTGDRITESESNTRDGITKSNTRDGDGITKSNTGDGDGITESESNSGDGI
ncbi:uncharacterized protein LOC131620597 [Vicia villosa]|nr:uncharacterized protein LOC131620597 [Vicia villosa]